MKLFNVKKLNNLGLSLMELVCAIAIASVVFAGIAGSIVVTTKYYAKGANDIALQQSAQVLTNFLTNLVVDAKDVVSDDTGTWLRVTDTYGSESTISYDGKQLTLVSSRGTGILSDNLSSFSFVNNYEKTKSVNFKFVLDHDKRHFNSSFTATSRNGLVFDRDGAVIILDKSVVLAEPNEKVIINYYVFTMGSVVDSTIEGAGPVMPDGAVAGDSTWQITPGQVIIDVGSRETLQKFSVTLATNAKYIDDDGNPISYDTKTILVKVRRVNNINLSSNVSFAAGSSGEEYVITANFNDGDVFNGSFLPADETPGEYYNPFLISMDPVDPAYYSASELASHPENFPIKIVDNSGNYLPVSEVLKYIEFKGVDLVDPAGPTILTKYKFKFKIKKDGADDLQLPYGSKIGFTIKADHSYGVMRNGTVTNRTSVPYYKDKVVADTDLGVSNTWWIQIKPPVPMMDSGFLRGKECYLDEYIDSTLFPPYNSSNAGALRYRERNADGTYGEWSTFVLLEHSGSNYKFPKDVTQFLFKPNMAYELEMVPVSFSGGKVVSPNYYALFDSWGHGMDGTTGVPETIYSCGNRIEIDACQIEGFGEDNSIIRTNPGENSEIKFKCSDVTSFESSVQDALRLNCTVSGSQSDGLGFKFNVPLKDNAGNPLSYDVVVGMDYTVYEFPDISKGFVRISDLTLGASTFYPFIADYDSSIDPSTYSFTYSK